MKKRLLSLIFLCVLAMPCSAGAEEGMWTFDNLPLQSLSKNYSFEPSQDWIDHARLASVKFRNGSGSFISNTGLVLTNHHIVRGDMYKISTPERDIVKNGFYAPTRDKELRFPDMEIRVLTSLDNVTPRLDAAVKGLSPSDAAAARKKEISLIEKEYQDRTGNKADVVTLYHGGEYWLYCYKTCKDVRLVCAPENQAAHFGGKYDNFTYPRYTLDWAIVRAYENDRPLAVAHYFPVNPAGVKADELVFTIGHPGTTSRQLTSAQVHFLKEKYYPLALEHMKRAIQVLEEYSEKGGEQRRRAFALINSIDNNLKRAEGEYAGLNGEGTMATLDDREKKFRRDLAGKSVAAARTGDPWDAVAKITLEYQKRFRPLYYITKEEKLLGWALQLVTMADEIKKPDSERLSAYRTSKLASLREDLLSTEPVYRDMEEVQLADYCAELKEKLGDDPYTKELLAGASPAERARQLMASTSLDRVDCRKELLDGGEAAIMKSKDPLIVLARRIQPLRREMLRWSEVNYIEALVQQHELIARARFALYGKSVYPDGTGTLRMAYGTIRGYSYNGTIAPPMTTFWGMYDRFYSFNRKEWDLPKSLLDGRNRIDLSTPLNFVNTCDTTGGNSGSPVINRKGELVGLNFDSTFEALAGRYIYRYETKRAMAVGMGAIVEVLRNVYGAGSLADEITAARR